MYIKLQPKRDDTTYVAAVNGEKIIIDYTEFDFSRIEEGSTLPARAIACNRFAEDVERKDGMLRFAIFLPNPKNYSQAQAFPLPLLNPEDGQLPFPDSLPDENGQVNPVAEYDPNAPRTSGYIDWAQLITKAQKDASAQLAVAKAELSSRNARTSAQIARIQDRIDTIGYGIEAGEATEEDEAELAALALSIKAWKTYKFALGKVSTKPSWPATPEWPVEPPIPDISGEAAFMEE